MVKAEGIKLRISSKVRLGRVGIGNPSGICGKRDPIVSTGKLNKKAIMDTATIETKYAGIFVLTFLDIAIIAKPNNPKTNA